MKTERIISILLKISNNKITRAKELSNEFEVSLRNIYRDIESLSTVGIPNFLKGMRI
jgi:predicted DNA-binding transcriptional regulator YafY